MNFNFLNPHATIRREKRQKHSGMKSLFLLSSMLLAAVGMCACSTDDGSHGDDPVPGAMLAYEGAQSTLAVEVDGAWRIQSNADWCQVERSSGYGVQNVAVNAVYNRTGEARKATVTVWRVDYTRAASVAQTVTYQQQANADEVIPAHFTDARIEDNKLMFRLYTGPRAGVVSVVSGSCVTWSPMGMLADSATASEPDKETDWLTFTSTKITGEDAWAQLNVAGVPTANKLKIVQPSCVSLPDADNQNTADVHFVLDGKLYYGGGIVSYYQAYMLRPGFVTREAVDFHCYDPATGVHTSLADLDFSIGRAAVMDGAAYVYTGNTDENGRNIIYKYDPKTDKWSRAATHLQQNNEAVAAFYASNGLFNIVTTKNRYCYTPQQLFGGEAPSKTIPNGVTFGSARQFVGSSGEIFIESGGKIYRQTDTGFSAVVATTGQLLGAWDGCVYYYDRRDDNSTLLYKLYGDGSSEQLHLIFDITESYYNGGGFSHDVPNKYAEIIDGTLYLFGGTVGCYNPRPELGATYTHSTKMTKVDLKNYFPADVLVVTEK